MPDETFDDQPFTAAAGYMSPAEDATLAAPSLAAIQAAVVTNYQEGERPVVWSFFRDGCRVGRAHPTVANGEINGVLLDLDAIAEVADGPAKIYLAIGDEPECVMCKTAALGGGPRHDGSPTCRSGSIASGGHRSHCTCDGCF